MSAFPHDSVQEIHMPLLSRRSFTAAALSVVTAVGVVIGASAQNQSRAPTNIDAAGVAVGGYDPVAYFTLGKPTRGTDQFTASHDSATYRFATAAHKAQFELEPAKYVPQYGGYCAYAVSKGYTAAIDPTAWQVVGGKLYLNYNAAVAKTWSSDVPGYVKAADANWIEWPTLKRN